MTRSRTLPLLAMIAALALTSAAPPQHLAPCLHGRFKDLTQTLPDGTIVGEPDPHDWGCVGGGSGSSSGASGTSDVRLAGPGVRGAADVPVGPAPAPTAVCMDPAAPNPAEVATRIQFELPLATRVTVYVVRHARRLGFEPDPGVIVRTLVDATLAAGTHAIYWDLSDDAGDPLAAGIYRVVLVAGDEALCGDVEVR